MTESHENQSQDDQKVALIEKPEKPGDDECCGGGACCPCVWEHYADQLKLWKAQNEQKKTTG